MNKWMVLNKVAVRFSLSVASYSLKTAHKRSHITLTLFTDLMFSHSTNHIYRHLFPSQSIGRKPHLRSAARLFWWTVLLAPPLAGWQRSDRGTCRRPAPPVFPAGHDLRPQQNHPHPGQGVCQPLKSGGSVSAFWILLSSLVLATWRTKTHPWPFA